MTVLINLGLPSQLYNMLFPAEMERVRMAFLSEDRERVLESLQEQGVIEIKEISDRHEFLNSVDVDLDLLSSLYLRSEKLYKEFERSGRPEGLLESLFGKRFEKDIPIKMGEMKGILEGAEKVIGDVEDKFSNIVMQIEANKKAIGILKSEIKMIKRLGCFDFDFGLIGSLKETFACVGGLGIEGIVDLKNDLKDFRVYVHTQEIEEGYAMVIIGLKSEEGEIRRFLIKHGFDFFDTYGLRGNPAEILKEKTRELVWYEKKRKYLEKKKKEFSDRWWKEIERTHLVLNAYRDRFRSLQFFKETKYVSVLEGWIPKRHESRLKDIINKVTSERVFFTFEESGDMPTCLENPNIVNKFELITGGFGLPGYKSIDPTLLTTLLFPVFFGFMLGDIFYGFLIILLSFSMRYYFRNAVSRAFSVIVLLCGISSMAWGLLFGNLFGNLLGFQGFWFEPTKNPIFLIIVSLVFGLVHVNTGIVFSFIQKLKNKKSIKPEISWFLLEVGSILIIFRFFGWVTPPVFYTGVAIFMAGFALKMRNPINLVGMTSFFGNFISYVRLAAISLATSYIALTVNNLASLFSGISLIISSVVFIVGHVFNCIISSVGAFINSLRLHYVEFFSQFFEGDGKAFEPLRYEGIKVK